MTFETMHLNKYHDPLTPNIKLSYTIEKELHNEAWENLGYYVYEVKSYFTNEIYHLRALNLRSSYAEKHGLDNAITLFLQETIRLCTLHPGSIMIDTFEFYEN